MKRLFTVLLIAVVGVSVGVLTKLAVESSRTAQLAKQCITPIDRSAGCDFSRGSTFPDILLADSLSGPVSLVSTSLPTGGMIVLSSSPCGHCDSVITALSAAVAREPELGARLLMIYPPSGNLPTPVELDPLHALMDIENVLIGRCGVNTVPFAFLLDAHGRLTDMGLINAKSGVEWLKSSSG